MTSSVCPVAVPQVLRVRWSTIDQLGWIITVLICFGDPGCPFVHMHDQAFIVFEEI